jgi:hypothetical protein
MNTPMIDIESYLTRSVIVVPLVLGIVEALKLATAHRIDRYAALVSIAIGCFIAFILNVDEPWTRVVLAGIIYGLSASGLFSVVKTTAAGTQ